MNKIPVLTAAAVLGACASYTPDPVDLQAHAREFATRMPDLAAVQTLVQGLRADARAPGSVDLATAHTLALWFNGELREQRQRTQIATAAKLHAGRLEDPELGLDLQRVLETTAHPWLVASSLGLTVPFSGRLRCEQDLATSEHALAVATTLAAEARVLHTLDAAWVQWSALELRAQVLREHGQQVDALHAVAQRLLAAQAITTMAARTFTLERTMRRAELLAADAEVAGAALRRDALLGLPPGRALPFAPVLQVPALEPEADVRRQRLVDGPRLVPARSAHAVAERSLELAVAAQWPDLRLGPGFAEEDAQPRAALSVTLPLPLWNGSARAIAVATAGRELAATQLRNALEAAVAELARAELRLLAAQAVRQFVDRELVPLAETQLADSRRLLEHGQLDTLLLLDSLSRITDARLRAIDAARDEAEATIAVNALFWPAAARLSEESR